MSSDGPSKTKKEKKETNTINPKTVIAIKIYVRSMFLIFHSTVTDLAKFLGWSISVPLNKATS